MSDSERAPVVVEIGDGGEEGEGEREREREGEGEVSERVMQLFSSVQATFKEDAEKKEVCLDSSVVERSV